MSVLCYLTPKIRESNCYTVSQLLETKYGSKARTISAVIIALAMVSIVSYQYRGLGFIFKRYNWYSNYLLYNNLLCTCYCTSPFWWIEDSCYDRCNVRILMVGGLAIGLPVLISTVGGWDWVISSAQANDPESLTFFGGRRFLNGLADIFR